MAKVDNWSEFIKNHFSTLPYFKFMEVTVLSTSRGTAKLKLPVKAEYSNTYGIAHGGIIASLVDMASGVALRTLKFRILTLEVSVNYFKPVQLDDELIAEAKLVQEGRKILHADIDVFNQNDDLVARGRAIYFVLGEDNEENYDLETYECLNKISKSRK